MDWLRPSYVGMMEREPHDGRRLIAQTLIVLALLAFVAYWWFGAR
jgi:hypothetical protein